METQQMPPQSTPPIAPQAPLSDEQDIQQNKLWALLSYFGILFLIPLLAKKESKFAQFHAKQGLILFIADLIWMIPIIGWMIGFVLMILTLVAIIKVLMGEYWKVPVLGDYIEKINI
jgi:uncharacterized membrane protein